MQARLSEYEKGLVNADRKADLLQVMLLLAVTCGKFGDPSDEDMEKGWYQTLQSSTCGCHWLTLERAEIQGRFQKVKLDMDEVWLQPGNTHELQGQLDTIKHNVVKLAKHMGQPEHRDSIPVWHDVSG